MAEVWVVKKGDKYYYSSLRHPETNIILRVKWVDSLVDARLFKTKEEASELWGDNQKPKNTQEVSVTITEN